MYAIGCNFADLFYRHLKDGGQYRTVCLHSDGVPRTDDTHLETVLWRMVRQNRSDRLEDIAKLKQLVEKVTHITPVSMR